MQRCKYSTLFYLLYYFWCYKYRFIKYFSTMNNSVSYGIYFI